MKPKFEYINIDNLAKCENKQYYIFAGGRGSCKSKLEFMKRMIKLLDDIEACNKELAKIERRNNEEKNNRTN